MKHLTTRRNDVFPHARHVETVCLLVLRNPVTHVNIDVDVEELVQDKRGQATYEQIKEYVLEQTGLKVSSLYISQIKLDWLIYNKPLEYAQRVLGDNLQVYLKGKPEHRISD